MEREIIGYENYTITKEGVVKSYKTKTPKILKPQKASQSKKGYQQVRLFSKETPKGKLFYIHRLVWETFVESIDKNMTIDHIDNDTKNNNLDNLQVLSQRENQEKWAKSCKGYTARGLRDELVKDYKILGTLEKVAEKWGLTISMCWRVIKNKVNYYDRKDKKWKSRDYEN